MNSIKSTQRAPVRFATTLLALAGFGSVLNGCGGTGSTSTDARNASASRSGATTTAALATTAATEATATSIPVTTTTVAVTTTIPPTTTIYHGAANLAALFVHVPGYVLKAAPADAVKNNCTPTLQGSPCDAKVMYGSTGRAVAVLTAHFFDDGTSEDNIAGLARVVPVGQSLPTPTEQTRAGRQVLTVDTTTQSNVKLRIEIWWTPDAIYEINSQGQPVDQFEKVVDALLAATAHS